MSFFKQKYLWSLALVMVFLACTAQDCPQVFNRMIYGVPTTANLPARQKREEEQRGASFFNLGLGFGSGIVTPQTGEAASRAQPGATFTPPPSADAVVLLAGGALYNSTAEILTLGASPSFAPTVGPMMTARSGQTANLITSGSFDGQVLLAGGDSISGTSGFAIGSAERYNPGSGTFTCVGPVSPGTLGCPKSMVSARHYHAATSLEDGTVLFTGGVDQNNNILSNAEIYNPATDSFSATTGSLPGGFFDHTATLINTGSSGADDGMVLVAGGFNSEGNPQTSGELYNPATGMFTATANSMTAGAPLPKPLSSILIWSAR